MVTLKDIAKRVGRSVTTVSRALYGYDDVSPETTALVQKTAEEMGYRPNIMAQRLQKRKTDTIGFIIPTFGPRFSDPFFSEFLAGIGNKASNHGYDLLVSTHPPGDEEMEAYRRMVEGGRTDGFIIVRTRRKDCRVEYLLERDFPFAVFGRVEGIDDFTYVDEDSVYGMRLIADHLVERGHRKIGCIAPDPELMFAEKRLRGLVEGLAAHSITINDENIQYSDLTQGGGYKAARLILDNPNPPTAIAACNDLMAIGAINAAQERGLVVGKDIAITGFDDIPVAEYTHPPLTTLHQPIYKIGGMLCELLIDQIKDKSISPVKRILRPDLIIRQSSDFQRVNQ